MKSAKDTFTLNNNVEIPCVGFGTWQAEEGETAFQAVKTALDAGYLHIDTAAGYGNEKSVGRAVKESGLPREDVFITSKLGNQDHGYKEALAAFEKTMNNLDMDYLDLYLIHWPNPVKYRENWQQANAGTWKAFEELYEAGKIRSIGISNFLPHHIDALMETARIKPMVNQIKLCPGETQQDVVDYCRKQNILLEAYSPLGTGEIFDVPEMKALSEKYKKTIAQIALKWSLQMDFLPLPKSVTASRIRENIDLFDFELSQEDVKMLAGLTDCCGKATDPDSTSF